MVTVYGRRYTRRELLERIGDVSQIAGVKKVRFTDGPEDGVEAFNVRTGSGLSFTVVASRGLDISHADWCGRSLAWMSPTGVVAPQFYEEPENGWLRGFYGGLMVTCGLTQVGAANVDQGQALGLHGRASNIPAHSVSYDQEWQEDEFVMRIRGRVHQVSVYGENLLLTRCISARLGDDRIWIEDTVENQGYESTPHMLLYHINGGFPVVDGSSGLISPTLSLESRDVEVSTENYDKAEPPTAGFMERVYYHQMASESDGTVVTALVNRDIPGGFGLSVQYSIHELPVFTEWKMNGLGTYVMAMEPGNCRTEGRAKERERGTLQMLEPGEVRRYKLEIAVLTSHETIARVTERIEKIKQKAAS